MFVKLLLAFVTIQFGSCIELELVRTGSNLPVAMYKHTVVYDGDNAVYIMGGKSGTRQDAVIKYEVQSGTVGVIGSFRPVSHASATYNPATGHIVHFGGYNDSYIPEIYNYAPQTHSYNVTNRFPSGINSMASSSDGQKVYLFGGYGNSGGRRDSIYEYNIGAHQLERIGTLPELKEAATSVWTEYGIYVFGGQIGVNDILHFDPVTKNVIKLTTRLPRHVEHECSVYVNGKVYITHSTGVIEFDPVTEQVEVIQVESWPISLFYSSCTYIPSLGRLYLFGGWGAYTGNTYTYLDHISYIQLEDPSTHLPTSSTTEQELPISTDSSICPPTGTPSFPYPGNCTLYIKCFDGIPQTLSCAPLIFDKIDLVCKPESEAICDEEDPPNLCPPDGYEAMPHPSNCSRYYECINGNRYESECAPHTYFDTNPEIVHCNQAEHAVCHAECPETGLEFQPIRGAGCKWYKICLNGASSNLQCGDGEVYSPAESRCTPESNYICPYSED